MLKAVLTRMSSKWGTEVLGLGDSGDTYACYFNQEECPESRSVLLVLVPITSGLALARGEIVSLEPKGSAKFIWEVLAFCAKALSHPLTVH